MFHFASTFPTQFLGRFRAPRAQLAPFSYLLLLIGHMQTIFESKGDELSSSAECGIWTQGLRHPKSPADKPTELWWIKRKKIYSTARPYEGSVGTIFIDRNRCLQYFISLQQYRITYWLQANRKAWNITRKSLPLPVWLYYMEKYIYVCIPVMARAIYYLYIYMSLHISYTSRTGSVAYTALEWYISHINSSGGLIVFLSLKHVFKMVWNV